MCVGWLRVWSPGLSHGIVGAQCIVAGGQLRENQSTRLSHGALKSVPGRDTWIARCPAKALQWCRFRAAASRTACQSRSITVRHLDGLAYSDLLTARSVGLQHEATASTVGVGGVAAVDDDSRKLRNGPR